MNAREVRRASVRVLTAGGALVLFLALSFTGCRENAPVQQKSHNTPALIQWRVGDSFLYDTWSLDAYGNFIQSSRSTSVRRVLRVNSYAFGLGNVTVMEDSIGFPNQPVRIDTVYIAQTDDGDLWQYGLVASIDKRYFNIDAAVKWDRIAQLSTGPSAGWTVPNTDSLGDITGEIFSEPDYFTSPVNGVAALFPALHIELFSYNFGYTFWLSTSPPVFARIIEPSSAKVNGAYRDLLSIRTQ